MEHTQFSDNYRAAYLSVANMVLQTHGWICRIGSISHYHLRL